MRISDWSSDVCSSDLTMEGKEKIDEIGWRILEVLQRNARMNFAELGRLVGLSAPAVAERVKRLEDRGVMTGYQAQVDRAKLGYGLTAFIRMRTSSDTYPRIAAPVRELPEILACHHVTGEAAFIM